MQRSVNMKRRKEEAEDRMYMSYIGHGPKKTINCKKKKKTKKTWQGFRPRRPTRSVSLWVLSFSQMILRLPTPRSKLQKTALPSERNKRQKTGNEGLSPYLLGPFMSLSCSIIDTHSSWHCTVGITIMFNTFIYFS